MMRFALLASILIVAALAWRASLLKTDSDERPDDWCPATEVCIPREDIERLGVPDYALAQDALPTEFGIRGFIEGELQPEALAIAIYPDASASVEDFEVVDSNAMPGFDRVRYAEKFGNQHTWRGMVGRRVREGTDFYAAEHIKFFCIEAGRCIVLVHDGRFEAQFDIAKDEVPKLPSYRDRLLELFHGWRIEP